MFGKIAGNCRMSPQQQYQHVPVIRKGRTSSRLHCLLRRRALLSLSVLLLPVTAVLVLWWIIPPLVLRSTSISYGGENGSYNDWFNLISSTLSVSDSGDHPNDIHSSSSNQPNQHRDDSHHHHRVAGLTCDSFGGPTTREAVEEMIYWYNIPSDTDYYHRHTNHRHGSAGDEEQKFYLTFEPDEGGWNNIRMALETTIAIAISMRRVLVLPPSMTFYLLWNDQQQQRHHNDDTRKRDKNVMSFHDFFHLESIQNEYNDVLQVITMEEFLIREGITGQLRSRRTGDIVLPNRTDWSTGITMYNFESVRRNGTYSKDLWDYIRDVTQPLTWDMDKCVAVFPDESLSDHEYDPDKNQQRQLQYLQRVLQNDQTKYGPHKRHKHQRLHQIRQESYWNNPTPVNATPTERLAEILGNRKHLCIYNQSYHEQQYKVLHMTGSGVESNRFLIHYYAFLFYENYHTDLFIKRFIRDHLRYIDEIQCGAARIIEAIRAIAQSNYRNKNNNSTLGTTNDQQRQQQQQYDSFHIRRGDFQYDLMHLSAAEIYKGTAQAVIPDGRTVYIATDETNSTFFDVFHQHYNVVFLRDFIHLIPNISPNYYGMIDQLVASKGEVFIGTFYSTFSGYINRLRGYHAQKQKLDGYDMGRINSYYYVPASHDNFRNIMQHYSSVQQSFWQQEFPVAWRDINHDVTDDMIKP